MIIYFKNNSLNKSAIISQKTIAKDRPGTSIRAVLNSLFLNSRVFNSQELTVTLFFTPQGFQEDIELNLNKILQCGIGKEKFTLLLLEIFASHYKNFNKE